jgi:outer membrane lipoprotein SlyB
MADRRVTYQLSILAGKSPEVLRSVAKEAQAAAAAITALSEAQAKAAGSLAGSGRATVQGAISGTSASAVIGAGSAARDPAQVAARKAEADALKVQREAEKKAAAERKAEAAAVAKAQKAEASAVAKAERDLQKQRDALTRQSMGTIQGNAQLEVANIRKLRAELEALGKLDEDASLVLEERVTNVLADAEKRAAQLAARGVNPNQAFGARGTRETAIGGGVLSGFFDQILGKVDGTGVRNFSEITEKAADVAGKADTALKTLAGALGVISPEAEAAASAAGDLVGSLEVLLTPAGAVVGAGAGVAASFAAVGAASVAAVFHIAGMADELRDLAKLSGVELVPEASIAGAERAADALGDVSLAGTAMAGVLAGAAAPALEELARDLLAVGLLAAKSFDGMLAGAGAFADYVTDSFGQAVGLGLTWPFELATLAVEKYLTALNSIMEATGVPQAVRAPFISAQNAVMDLADDIAMLRGEAGNAVAGAVRNVAADVGTGYRLLAGEVDGLAEAYADADKLLAGRKAQRAAEAADAAGSPAAAAADAIKAEADATAQAIAALVAQVADLRDSTAAPLDEIATRYQRLRFELYGVAQAAGEAGAAIAAQARVELDAAEERDRAAAVAESVALTNADIAASDSRRRAEYEAQAARPGQVVARIGAASQQLQQGNVVGAVGAATGVPSIAIAGEALGILATLGELGEEELRTRGETFARAVGEGLRILPGLILDILPDLAIALAEGVADALLDLPAAIGQAIRDAFRGNNDDPNQMVGGALGGAAAGAATGAIFGGPVGALIGAGIGAVAGGLAGRAADRNEEANRSRSAAESDLAAGIGAQPRTRRPDSRAVSVALTVRGSGVGMQRAIDLDTGPYGRLTGAR